MQELYLLLQPILLKTVFFLLVMESVKRELHGQLVFL